jgi:hypothetical protein
MAEPQPSKLVMRVRSSSPALGREPGHGQHGQARRPDPTPRTGAGSRARPAAAAVQQAVGAETTAGALPPSVPNLARLPRPWPSAEPRGQKNCSDFANWADANAWFRKYFPYYGDVVEEPQCFAPSAPRPEACPASQAGFAKPPTQARATFPSAHASLRVTLNTVLACQHL